MFYCEAFTLRPQASGLFLPEAINNSRMAIRKPYCHTSNNHMVWQYGLCIAIQRMVRKPAASRLATVQSGPDRGLFWRPFKKTGPYGPAPSDCSSVPKILDRTVRSGLFII